MSLAQTLFDFITYVMQYGGPTVGYADVFGLMALALTVSIPSEIILPFAGYLVWTRFFSNFWLVLVVATAGSLVGTVIDYAIGYYLGREAILRYGRYIHLSEKSLVSSENWFKKYGPLAVLLTRFVPLVRTVVAFPAGIAEMKMAQYLLYSTIGLVIWNAALIYVGILVGPSVQSIINSLSSAFDLISVAAVIIAVIVLYFWFRRPKKSKDEQKEATT
jgi:membrane protein DedA with SNARE-associated domain